MTCLLCLYWKLVKITYFCTYLCTQNRRDFVSRGTSWIGKQQCKHNCKTYTFDSNLSCHIIKKNPIVYFVFNEARNNTKRYADCVCMLCFGAFDIWECRKVSPCVRNGGSRLCFNIYYICPPPFRVTIVRSLWSANSTALARTLQLLSNVFDPFLHILFYPWQSKHP